jgi:hypothetical protein
VLDVLEYGFDAPNALDDGEAALDRSPLLERIAVARSARPVAVSDFVPPSRSRGRKQNAIRA